MTELVCILCPKGCRLQVDEADGYQVSGNACPRGEGYGKKELTNPTRTITSTVRIGGAAIERLPVKTDHEIPKKHIFAAMALLDNTAVRAPVAVGDVVAGPIPGTDAHFVATRSLGVVGPAPARPRCSKASRAQSRR